MPQMLAVKHLGALFQLLGLTGIGQEVIGGEIGRGREPVKVDILARDHSVNLAAHIWRRVFTVNSETTSGRIYRLYTTAFFIPLSSLSGGFTFAKDGAWTSDSASGTFAEAFVAGDTHAIIFITAGTIAINDTLTVTTGGHTANIDAVPVQGGSGGQLGEHGVVHTISDTLLSDQSVSGWYNVNAGGEQMLVMLYVITGGGLKSLTYRASTDTFTESGLLLTLSTSATEFHLGGHVGNSLMLPVRHSNANTAGFIAYNPLTDAAFEANSLFASGGGGPNACSAIQEWRGRLFSAHTHTGDDVVMVEFSGGVWQRVYNGSGSNAVGEVSYDTGTPAQSGALLFLLDDALYMGFIGDNAAASNSRGWVIHKFSILADGSIECDNLPNNLAPASEGQVQQTEAVKLATYLLGSAFAIGAGLPTSGNSRWFPILDQQTNGPDGEDIQNLYHSNLTTGALDLIQNTQAATALSGTIAWPGGTAASNVMATTADLQAEAPVGTPIKLAGQDKTFRVTAVTAANITVENPEGRVLPTAAAGISFKINPFVAVGFIAAQADIAPSFVYTGGGEYYFQTGDLAIAILDKVPASGGEDITFRAFSDDGATTGTVKMFHPQGGLSKRPDTQSTISDFDDDGAGSGSISGSPGQIDLVIGNGTSDYKVRHRTGSGDDNLPSGTAIRRVLSYV